ncbi:hypothetical protein LJC63_11540 [Ruminococcaceae bacterium OttesenSCG-928-L11]|nr:hypothetical protein [Ruminococcaceae bacterium OttesenSCG-928-L11]
MNEERTIILQMLKDGDITIEEAERLLDAIKVSTSDALAVSEGVTVGTKPKRLIVRVFEHGISKVNVRVPFSLVKIGLKMGTKFAANGEGNDEVNRALHDIDFDELLSEIESGEITLPYKIVDVEDGDKVVEVILE